MGGARRAARKARFSRSHSQKRSATAVAAPADPAGCPVTASSSAPSPLASAQAVAAPVAARRASALGVPGVSPASLPTHTGATSSGT